MKVRKINIRPVIGYSGSGFFNMNNIWIPWIKGEVLKSMTKNANQVAKFTVQFQFLKFGLDDIYVSCTEWTKECGIAFIPMPWYTTATKVSKFFPSIRFISERWSANSRIENDSIIVLLVAFNYLLGRFDCFLLLNRVQEKIYRQGGKPRVSSLISQ